MPEAALEVEPAPLPDAVVGWLVRLSVALHKHATYPPGHPTLRGATDSARDGLAALLDEHGELAVGVARTTLVVGDGATDEGHPVLRELAQRLHRREVGRLVFRRGVEAEELTEAFTLLSGEPAQVRARLRGEGGAPPSWPHVEVRPHAFDRLALAGDALAAAPASGANRLWRELASAALGGDLPADGGEIDPLALARALNARRGGGSARAMGELLLRLGREARAAEGEERARLERRLRELVANLAPATLAWLFGATAEPGARPLLTDAVDVLPADGVVELLQAAAGAREQSISHYLLRMLRKLAHQATGLGLAPEGDAALRDTAHELLERWTLDDPNPGVHAALLDHLAQLDRAAGAGAPIGASEGRRLLYIALETGAAGPQLAEGVELMLAARELGAVLDLVAEAPEGSPAAAAVLDHLRSPDVLRGVLLEEPVDQDACARLLQQVGPEHAEPLLDALAISESQPTRRLVLDRLAALGSAVGPRLVARLPEVPWYVQRNLLALLARLRTLPAGFSARPWVEHPEVTVRFQALNAMLRVPKEREEAIHLALADADPRLVRFGIDMAAQQGLPRASLTRLMLLLNSEKTPLDLRARGILLLEQVPTPATRDWLLARVVSPRTLLRGPRLHAKTPELLAALVALARAFADQRPAQAALQLAAKSGDPDLMAAARGQGAA